MNWGILLIAGKEKPFQHLGGTDLSAIGGFDKGPHIFNIVNHPLVLIHRCQQRLRVLVKVANVDGGANFNGARIRLDPSSDQVHQGRFARAIAADNADPIFGAKLVGEISN